MRHLRCSVPEAVVPRICEKGLLAPWKRLRQRRYAVQSGADPEAYPRVERIWFPYYLFTIGVTSRMGPGEMLVTVEAWSGAFAIFQLDEFFVDGMPDDGCEIFEPHLSVEACEASARKDLLHTIMRQRSRSGGKPIPGAITAREDLLYPFWIYYYYRKKNVLDIRVVDGATGQRVGHRTRAGVLDAFVTKKSSEDEVPPESVEA